MLSASAQAQPNIALIKYWGKRDRALNLPAVGSISITLDALWTRTRVSFDEALSADEVSLNKTTDAAVARRVSACLDLLRAEAGVSTRARVVSDNNFPTGAGLASSASGFAALVRAASSALKLDLSDTQLSVLARRGSGSAARSILGGFAEMAKGVHEDGRDAFARPILDAQQWPLSVVVAVTSHETKAINSTDGMTRSAQTSPYYQDWVAGAEADLAAARTAIAARDFDALAALSEYSCLKMHAVMLATQPGLIYWNGASVECMHRIRALREQGIGVFFTIDAGPQVKAICAHKNLAQVREALANVHGVKTVLTSSLGQGARLIADDARAPAPRE